MIQFVDDDKGYVAWLEANAGGYVINSYRTPTLSYLMLHKATCQHLKTESRSNWTRDYRKTCSTDADELRRWARTAVGGNASECADCMCA